MLFSCCKCSQGQLKFLKLNLKLTGSELQLEVKLGMLNIRKVEIIKLMDKSHTTRDEEL